MNAVKRPVFISFSSKDRKVAETIGAALETRGYSCWISSRNIAPGENYQLAIVHAINAAKILLLIFSANANTSDEIKKELALASQRRLMVIPVRIEDVVPDEGFSYELATRQWIDLFGDWEKAMGQLADQIGTLVPAQPHVPAAVADVASPFALKPATPAANRLAWPSRKIMALSTVGAALAVLLCYLAYQGLGRPDGVTPGKPRVASSNPSNIAAGQREGEPRQASRPAPPLPTGDLLKCFVADPDKAIEGCTEDLAEPDLSAVARANYYKFRGASYVRKLDYDAALADYNRAIALGPNDAVAFYLRAAVRRVKGDNAGADADAARAKALGYSPPHM